MTRAAALVLLLLFAEPASAGGPPVSVEDRGARHGQALAAAKHCPGARTTLRLTELASAMEGSDRQAFDAASQRIEAAWDKAFACRDVDPAQYPREANSCRKSKILNCSATWAEIGPEGSAYPGLLEFKPED